MRSRSLLQYLLSQPLWRWLLCLSTSGLQTSVVEKLFQAEREQRCSNRQENGLVQLRALRRLRLKSIYSVDEHKKRHEAGLFAGCDDRLARRNELILLKDSSVSIEKPLMIPIAAA